MQPKVTLSRIVYVSRAQRWLHALDVAGLAHRAYAWNALNGITGLLLFDGGRFLQAIEGPTATIADLMDRISRDERHHEIQISESVGTDARLFGGWAMRYRHLSENPSDDAFLSEVKAAVAPVRDIELQSLFIGFAALSRRR